MRQICGRFHTTSCCKFVAHAWCMVYLEVFATHQAGIYVDGAERHHTAFLEVKVKVLHYTSDSSVLLMPCCSRAVFVCIVATCRAIVSKYGHSVPFLTLLRGCVDDAPFSAAAGAVG